ncbi:MAG TPA: HD domain-containing phosphohydrolase, partial [Burkholderiales bacterium]|nr:HD domain-containing phosphohydrolase [Burkholderiales bacterium]
MATESSTKPTILVVDDTEDIRELVTSVLQDTYIIRPAFDGRSALKRALEKPAPDLVLLDVDMPGASGHDVCRALKVTSATADIPIIFLTSKDEPADVVKGFQLGAADYIIKPLNPEVLRARVRNHLELAYRRHEQESLVQTRTAELETARVQLVRRLARTMEYHESTAVGNRVVRLGHYARLVAQAAGAQPVLSDLMMKAAPLHDIGKLGVPAQVLHKSSGLSAPEWEQMKKHAEIGAEIIGQHNDPLLALARTLALTHHERWDGNGYPKGLKGEEIPWPGRVMALVDTFEALTVTRYHQDPLPVDGAATLIERAAGTQFDPQIVLAFKQVLPEMRSIRDAYADQLGDLVDLDFASPAAPDKRAFPPPKAAATVDHDALAKLKSNTADEEKALKLARQRNQAEVNAIRAAGEKQLAEEAFKRTAEARAAAEQEATRLAQQRAQAERTALEQAQARAAAEAAAKDAAEARAESELEGARLSAARQAAEADVKRNTASRNKAEAVTAHLLQQIEQTSQRTQTHLLATQSAAQGVAEEADAQRIAEQQAQVEAEAAKAALDRADAERAQAAAAASRLQADEALHAQAQARAEAESLALTAARERAHIEAAALKAAEDRGKSEQEAERIAQERTDAERVATEQAQTRANAELEVERLAAQRAVAERTASGQTKARIAAEQEAERLATQQTEADRATTEEAQTRAAGEQEAARR